MFLLYRQIFTFPTEPEWPGPDVSESVLAEAGHCSGSKEQKYLCLKIIRRISTDHILGLLQSGVVSIPGDDGQPDILGQLQKILTGDCLSEQ